MSSAAVTVRRARVSTRLGAAPARAALDRWLAGIEVQRYGLPADAIAVVRRLRAPWAALAGNDPLAAALRGAVRPAREGFVGAGVSAVWFADEAELLACLARDMLSGVPGLRWWWPLLFGGTPSLPAAARRWASGARAVPQALLQLAPAAHDKAWLDAIGAPGRAGLVAALAQAYPLCDAVYRCILACEPDAQNATLAMQPVPRFTAAVGPGETEATLQVPPRRVTAVQALLRLAEALRTDPQRAADDRLVEALLAPAPPFALMLSSSPATAAPARERVRPRGARIQGPLAPAARPAAEAPIRRDALGAVGVQREAALPSTHTAEQPAPAVVALAAADSSRTTPAPAWNQVGPMSSLVAQPQVAPSFDTGFGGLCFLLNIALALGLYGDFTQPQHRGLAVSPWRFLHAVGRAFFGRAFTRDALARWLRKRADPCPLPHAPVRWQLDAIVLRSFAADARPWHAVAAPDALRLVHPAGFVVAQWPASADPQEVLAALQRPHQAVVMHRTRRVAPCGDGLLGLLCPLLRARLALALGLPANPALDLALALPAHVQDRSDRLDVHFSLAALPLSVRLAGLDRDPGWIPAAGCDVRFHFD